MIEKHKGMIHWALEGVITKRAIIDHNLLLSKLALDPQRQSRVRFPQLGNL